MDMNLQKYQAFITTIEYGSFTKAAERLDYSQSAISRMINDLEKEWGVILLERSRSGVCLTSDGLALFPYVKRVYAEYQNLQSQIDGINGLQSGIIRIGTFSSVATHWLPNIIKRFQEDYPNIDYELLLGDYTEIESWVRDGRVDCGFTRLPAHHDLEGIFLEQDKLLEKGGKAEISEIFERYSLSPKVHFTTWDDYAIMSMVESGLGISILPQLILQRNSYRIVKKELEIPAYRNIGIVMRSKANVSLAVKKILRVFAVQIMCKSQTFIK